MKDTKKLEELVSRTYKFNEDAEKALVEFVNGAGGVIVTDCKAKEKYSADTLYGYVFDESIDEFKEVYIIAVFTYKDELYIKVSYSDNIYIDDINSINTEEDDDVYLVNGGMVLMSPTYHNLCETLPQYV